MTITEYIAANPSATDAEVLAWANTPSIERTDATAYTWSGLGKRLATMGVDPVAIIGLEQMLPALPGGSYLDKCLASGGVDFTDAAIRAGLTTAAAGLDAQGQALVGAILAVGVWQLSPWEVEHSRGTVATLEDIQAAIAVQRKSVRLSNASGRWDQTRGLIETGAVWSEIAALWSAE